MAEFSIHHPVTVCMVFASFIVLGLVSLSRIPVVLTPDIRFPYVEVYVPYRNATPAQVQEAIAKPVEEVLATIPNVQRIESRSSTDGAYIGLELNWGNDVDWLRAEVREKIDQIRGELPSDIQSIHVNNFGTQDDPVLNGRIISSQRDLRTAYDFVEAKIKRPLQRVPGVADVSIWGAQRKEVEIYLRLDDIKRHGVDVSALFRNLDAANLNFSLGKVVDKDRRYGAITRGVVRSLEDIRNFPVNGTGLRLHEIADVVLDAEPAGDGRRLNGEFAVMFDVRKSSQANTVETVRRVREATEEMKRDPALAGVELNYWWDSAKEITKAISGLVEAGVIGAVLAVVVLFLFLRKAGPTLVISLAIPFCIIAAIGFLYLLGKTLNVLSMMGLMLACGMLVDNAVVVLESIFQHLERGSDRISAALAGTRGVVTAVFAATMTSIIIFVPLVFGKTTDYSIWLADTGLSIMLSLVASLFFSLTLIPLGVARFVRFRPKPKTASDKPRAADRYVPAMRWCLDHPILVGLVIVPVIVVASLSQLGRIPDNSPEAEDIRDLRIQYDFSENYHYAKIERDYVEPVERMLLANKQQFKIRDVMSFFSNNSASTRVWFDQETLTLEELKRIREQIVKKIPVIPGAEIKTGRQEGNEGRNWIGVNLYGEDSATLQRLAREARTKLRQRPGFSEIHTDADRGREEVQIRLDREKAKKYGISAQSLSDILGIVVRGREVRGFRTPEGEINMWVRLQAADRTDVEDLKSIVVGGGPDGRDITLDQVASLSIAKIPGVIQRENRRTFQWMWIVYGGEKKDEGKKLIGEVLNSMNYPSGYGWSYGFYTEREDQEDKDFLFNIVFALAMVYFVMAALFESLAHPFSIMLSLPFALVGVVWMLILTGTPNNIMAKIGLMVLVGVVVNNGIVLIDHINNLRRDGMPRYDAVVEGCRERFRPILMTACTTVLGMLPLAAGDSGIFNLRYFPLARTVMGGLISSTVLTLLVLPTYYILFDDLSLWARRLWHRSSPAPATEESPAYGD